MSKLLAYLCIMLDYCNRTELVNLNIGKNPFFISAAGAPAVSSGGTVTAANWRKMQLQGCVFLPKAGSQTNYKAEEAGLYYTTNKSGSNPWIVFIGDNSITTQVYRGGDNCFIRLVTLL
jgi:hypothetical protein